MSLITELRCKTFEDIEGNKQTISILKKIIKDPNNKPRNLIFAGNFGNSKTTLAKIFGATINKFHENTQDYLVEVDSSTVARVEDMRELKPFISVPSSSLYKIVIFDEAHLLSKASCSQLLKLIEENTRNIFFIFCTTEVESLLDTIKSRSITFYVEGLTQESMYRYLKKLPDKYFNKEYLEDGELLDLLFLHSTGHYRDLIQQIDLLQCQGLEEYKKYTLDFRKVYANLLAGQEEAKLKILQLPIILIANSWDFYIRTTEVPMHIVTTHLQYRDKLKTTTDWYLFFNMLSTSEPKNYNIKVRR